MFAHDSAGVAVTGKVTGDWTKRISKNAGAFAAMTVVITELENGWYSVAMDTGHTDTLGILTMTFTASGVMQVNVQYRVSARILDDLAYPQTSGRALVVTATGATNINWGGIENPTTAVNLSGTNIDVDQVVASVSGAVGSVTGAVGSVTAAVTITAASVQAIWDALTSALTTVGSVGKRISDFLTGDAFVRLGAPAGASVSADVAAIKTETASLQTDTNDIQTRLPTALVSGAMRSSLTAADLAADAVTEIQAAILSDATPFAGGNINATISSRATPAQVNAEMVDALNVDTYAELASVPSATSTIVAKLNWLFLLARNKITQTATTQTALADDGTTTVATSTVSDDGTTFTKGEFS